jgi:Ca-activated chloride channel family protein
VIFRPIRRLFCAAVCALPAAQPASAQTSCGVTLILAIDVSASVDAREYELQMQGLAGALRDGTIRRSIVEAGGIQAIAFEWSGRHQQVDIVPWSFLATDADIFAFADGIARHRRGYDEFPTALGYALGHAAIRLGRAPLACARNVVDVSGDGVNNEGYEPFLAYKNFDYSNVTVNGLVIAGEDPDPVGYYREKVIHGPGAFVEVAADFEDYEAAMKRKLLREINGAALSFLSAPHDGMRTSAKDATGAVFP